MFLFHDLGGREAQADRHDGLRVCQQREGLSVQSLGPDEDLHVIAESMYLLCVEACSLKTQGLRVEEGAGNYCDFLRRRASLYRAWRA